MRTRHADDFINPRMGGGDRERAENQLGVLIKKRNYDEASCFSAVRKIGRHGPVP